MFFSEITDYYRLRIVVNFILGLLISSSLYHAGWKNLNFGDFDYTYALIVKWTIISFSTYAFTVSPLQHIFQSTNSANRQVHNNTSQSLGEYPNRFSKLSSFISFIQFSVILSERFESTKKMLPFPTLSSQTEKNFREFWMIDRFREIQGQTHIGHFSKQEKVEWKIMEVFSFPTKAERSKAIRPFFKWFVLALTVAIVSILDYYLFVFLDSVVESARQQIKQKASAPAGLNITGEGVLADFLKTMTSTNATLEIDQTLSNEHCLTKPLPPNTDILIYWLGIPLLLSFLFQVVFSFAIRRIVLNYFLPFMFPRRSRVRLIQFYNKCLVNREKHRKEARARIRFMVDRRRIETLHKGFLFPK
ncbi:hypothetical protein CAEBREN_32598 [Caenorhabditis brenneri]|uniref:Dendritic cell-specific transmembrane protein-like domain-containing protein n=1 Tax=Caenorhabditis brenneri TaxID=135651 RepID=G0PKJ9_CAEBE|nr:hypothetical protein CAEBREN_32598 [Caenorhabditis brenneri]